MRHGLLRQRRYRRPHTTRSSDGFAGKRPRVGAAGNRASACWRSEPQAPPSSTTMQHNKVIRGVSLSRLVSRASALAIVAVLALPIAVWAHAHLRRSDPSARARVTTPPTAIRLWFTERPELGFTRVQLRAADTTEIALGAVTRLGDDPMGVAIAIPRALTPGSYTVLWRTAAADGHAT